MRTSSARGAVRRGAAVLVAALTLGLAACTEVTPDRLTDEDSRGSAVLAIPVFPVGAPLAVGPGTPRRAERAVDAVISSAASGIRITADMRWLCPTRKCDLAPLDPVITQAAGAGLEVYLHVNSTPAWLDPRGRWYPPIGAGAEEWAALFGQLVLRYGTAVTAYEVWNEPNTSEFWRTGPDAGDYADLLKAVWVEAKRIDPEVQLVGAVLSNNDLGFMRQLSAALQERGGNRENRFFYDLLGVHPYAGARGIGYPPERPAGSADVQTPTGTKDMTFLGVDRLRAQVAREEGIWRDVVIGEFGYDTTPGAWYHVPEPRRAVYLATALRLAGQREWIRSFSIYSYSAAPDDGFSVFGTPSQAVAGIR